MVNYAKGKIYKIIGNGEATDPCYVGSTTKNYLSQRLVIHRSHYEQFKEGKFAHLTAFDIFDKYGIENCKIILLENVNAKSKDELRMKEQEYIDKLDCVNKNNAVRTPEMAKRLKREYYDQHVEKLTQQRRDRHEQIKEIENAKTRARYEGYSEEYRKKRLESRKVNKHCDICNCDVRASIMLRHTRTAKHINAMALIAK
jgi:hypothetical protein